VPSSILWRSGSGRCRDPRRDRINLGRFLTDQRCGVTYFLAAIRPDAAARDEQGGLRLHPGMPGTVFILTGARTALDYLVGPLTIGFRKAAKG
jgi:multidrug efflux pump subunit AcrA (membrane-fusion protein)